jgi:hypothetical protein
MTTNQATYQAAVERKRGKYSKINPCERCKKSAGVDYWSLSNCNETGQDVCLCESCAKKFEAMIQNGTFVK